MKAIRLLVCAVLAFVPLAASAQEPPPRESSVVACDRKRDGDTCSWEDVKGAHAGICRERRVGDLLRSIRIVTCTEP